MRRILFLILIVALTALPVTASEYNPPAVPESALMYMPDSTESFSDGLWSIIKSGIATLQPDIAQTAITCSSLIAIVLLIAILKTCEGQAKLAVNLTGTLTISALLIHSSASLIVLTADTVIEIGEYGKLLLPVMTSAMAAQGGVTSASTLYTGTLLFNAVLTTIISKVLIPLIYIYVVLCIANSAMPEDLLKNMCGLFKWLITWCLKIILYTFTGYISITGVISGSADAAAVKATKIAISGGVPVVGSIISDASETILVSAGLMKTSTGVVGLLSLLAILIGPFLKIGVQYLLLKLTAAVCSVFGSKESVTLIKDFSGIVGLLLAMVGTICLLHLISTVCFMRGIS